MKKSRCRIVLVTCATLSEARKIARAVVEQRLAACVNVILTPAESIYRWRDRVEVAREYLLIMKSVAKRLPELQRCVQRLHSYDVPEFVVLPIAGGSSRYINWLIDSVSRTRGRRK
jgi:periplasmic divalent cation tolerance protein